MNDAQEGSDGPRPRPVPSDRWARLPTSYREALRLRAAGLDEIEIAERLELAVESVGPLLRLAESKAERIGEGEHGSQTPGGHDHGDVGATG